MKAVILQSNYLPWKGYFDLIHDADLFVFYDNVKYTKNDWRNRNLIYSKNGLHWLTIPIPKDSVKLSISQVRITDTRWQEKHLKTLCTCYRRARYFSNLEPLLEDLYLKRQWSFLADLNHYSTQVISRMLGIHTRFESSRNCVFQGDRVTRLVDLLKQLGATQYITGPAAREYFRGSELLFEDNGIEVVFKDYSGYPEYPQLKLPFTPQTSIVDMIANLPLGDIGKYIWGWREQG